MANSMEHRTATFSVTLGRNADFNFYPFYLMWGHYLAFFEASVRCCTVFAEHDYYLLSAASFYFVFVCLFVYFFTPLELGF